MQPVILFRLFFILCFLQPLLLHAKDNVSISPAEDWVIPYPISDPDPVFQTNKNSLNYLLVDYQTRITENGVEHFYHFVFQVNDLKAVQENSTLFIGFNPEYEELILHSITNIRNRTKIEKLRADRIQLLNSEQELEYQIFNGTKMASIILEDIRVGDKIEYSFTLKGNNPVFNHLYFGKYMTQWSVPVHAFKLRFLHPENRKINIRYHGERLSPQIFHNNQFKEYRWEASKLKPISNEGDLPSNYSLYPWIQFSEADSWNDIIEWAMPLYQSTPDANSELQEIIHRISSTYNTKDLQLLAVLQFVQEKIRYLGIEIGTSSYQPNPPSLVLKRRFGDCKDKTLLMVALLQELRIEAYPALVNTKLRDSISKWLPSATAFNHVIVHAKLNGKTYWLDPTRWPQKGTLNHLYQPDYGKALLIKTETKHLIPMPKARVAKKVVTDKWEFNEQENSALYQIDTEYTGHLADDMRQNLKSNPQEETEKSYVNYFAKIYPDIIVHRPFKISDDTEKNVLNVEEFYKVLNVWQKDKDKQNLEANFYPADFYEYVRKPTTLHRKLPYALRHPVHIEQKTRIHIGKDWNIPPSKIQLSNRAFNFVKSSTYANGVLNLEYRYHSTSSSITAEDMPIYLTDREAMDNSLGYRLLKYGQKGTINNQSGQINWTLMVLFSVACIFFLIAATRIYKYDSNLPKAPLNETDENLNGIRSWLILAALGLIATPILVIKLLYTEILPLLFVTQWDLLTGVGSELYHPGWAPLIITETLANLGLLFFSSVILLLFFQKRRSAPGLYIKYQAITIAAVLLDYFVLTHFEPTASQMNSSDLADTIRSVVFSIIWIAYFKTSKRVKATFTKAKA